MKSCVFVIVSPCSEKCLRRDAEKKKPIFQQLSPKYFTFYEIMWKSFVQPDRRQMTIWLMHIACWITKATERNTNSEYVIRIAFPTQERLHERALLLRYTNIACLIFHSLTT